MKKNKVNGSHQPFDKYELYRRSVQSPESDVIFFEKVYKELKRKRAKILREDFCGTFSLAIEWIKLSSNHRSIGIDLDSEPLNYGRQHYLSKLRTEEQSRIHLIEGDVLKSKPELCDILVALNFSYFIFKSRKLLKSYFKMAYDGLENEGVFLVDTFGGSQCYSAIEDRTPHKNFSYYWDQVGFDPISNYAEFYIHFRVGGKKYEKVFSYDWRMWSIPELREIMEEVGFRKTHVYWEGTKRDGTGNGVFTRSEKGEPCLSWIAYIAGEK